MPHLARPQTEPLKGLPSDTNRILEVCQLFDTGTPKLHLKQCIVLFYVASHPRLTQRELCAALNITQTNISVILAYLADVGWVESIGAGTIPSPSIHSLTLAGLKFVRSVNRILYGNNAVPHDDALDSTPRAEPSIARNH